MNRQLGHLKIAGRRYNKITEESTPLDIYGYALAYYPNDDPLRDPNDPPFGYYINIQMPGGNKIVELSLPIEQLAEALLDTARARNRPNGVDRAVVIGPETVGEVLTYPGEVAQDAA